MRQRLGLIFSVDRRRRLVAGLALVVAAAVVAAIVLSTGSSSSATTGGNSAAASGAATVQQRDLVQTDTESGTLSYANPQTVYNRLTGTITWLPSIGQEVKPGQALYKVDGEPVILMNGATPAYRDLNASDSDGPDIRQLNQNLVALDDNPDGIVVDDIWQPATTAGVEVFQEALGEAPTGDLTLGQIVFLPGPQLVSAVDATLGSTGSGGSSASTTVDPPGPEFVSLTTTTAATTTPTTAAPAGTPPSTPTSTTTAATTTPSTTSPAAPAPTGSRSHPRGREPSANRQTLEALISLLRTEIAELRAERSEAAAGPSSPSSPSSAASAGSVSKPSSGPSAGGGGSSPEGSSAGDGSSSNGSGGGSATAILQTTSTQLVVTVDLGASMQSEAKVGERVMIEMPAGNTVNGTITAVSPVAQSSDNSNGSGAGGGGGGGENGNNGNGGSSSTVPVTITLMGHVSGAGLDQAAVSVNFVEAVANNVLSVPVTALLATSGQSYAVQEAQAPHKLIPVTTGLFAAGYVQISGRGIYPGLQVTDSQG